MLPRNTLRPRRGHTILSVATAAGLLLAASGASLTTQVAPDDDAARPERAETMPASPERASPVAQEIAVAMPEPPAELALGSADDLAVAAPDGAIAGSQPAVTLWQPASQESAGLPGPAEPAAPSSVLASADLVPQEVVARPKPIQRATGLATPRIVSSAFTSRVLGKWVPDREACGDPDASDYLPLRISAAEASAGDAACKFVSRARHGQAWEVVAECSDGAGEWNAKINLAVAGGQLTWSSERGVQTYVRCEETRIAKRATKEQVAFRATKPKSKVAARKAPPVRVIGGGSTPKTWALLRVR